MISGFFLGQNPRHPPQDDAQGGTGPRLLSQLRRSSVNAGELGWSGDGGIGRGWG